MKKIFGLFVMSAFLFSITACDKDDDPVNGGNLVGEWKLTDVHADNGVSETIFLGQTITASYDFHGTDYNIFTNFTENPNEFTSSGSYTVITNITTAGQTVSDTTTVDAFAGTGKWSINGNELTQIFAGDTSTFEILELSDTKLRLKDELDATVVDTTFGLTIHDRATVFSSFEKQ